MVNLIMKGLDKELKNKGNYLEVAKKHIDKRIENIGLIVGKLSKMTQEEYDKEIKNELENIKMITFEVNRIKKMSGFLRRKEIGDYIVKKTIEVLRNEAMKLGKTEKQRMSIILDEMKQI